MINHKSNKYKILWFDQNPGSTMFIGFLSQNDVYSYMVLKTFMGFQGSTKKKKTLKMS